MTRKLILIDGSNLYAALRGKYKLDYLRLVDYFGKDSKFVYFTALPDKSEINRLQPMVDFLKFNHFQLVTKEMKTYTQDDGEIKRKGNMDIEIAVYAMAMSQHYKHISLFSGDGDFCCLINHLQVYNGCCIDVYSSKELFADSIRAQADNYHYIENMSEVFGDIGTGSSERIVPKFTRFRKS